MTDEGKEGQARDTATPPASEAPPPAPDSPRCWQCRKPIETGAWKCTQCDAYQGLVGRFIAMLLAFKWVLAAVVVLGAALGAYLTYFPSAPRTAMSFPICISDKLVVTIENKGGTAMEVSPLKFERRGKGGTVPRDMDAVIYEFPDGTRSAPMSVDDSKRIEPGRSLKYIYPTDGPGFFRDANLPCTWQVKATVRWNDKSTPAMKDCSCGSDG